MSENGKKQPNDHIFNDYLIRLNVDDNYENLPNKTLSIIAWFLENSNSNYLFKVDDDCFVNAEIFPELVSRLKGDYIGKIIETKVGPDRMWHKSKSDSQYAKNNPDLPEIYQVGVMVELVTFSRYACKEILKQLQTSYGQILLHNLMKIN